MRPSTIHRLCCEDRLHAFRDAVERSEEHTSELQSQSNLVCRLLLEKKKIRRTARHPLTSTEPQDQPPRADSEPPRTNRLTPAFIAHLSHMRHDRDGQHLTTNRRR